MFSWNVYRRLLAPDADLDRLKWIIRGSVVLLGVGSTLLALRVQSVIELWTLCSDLVFVLLFPQLVMALFDPRANRLGSMAAFAASLGIRLGAGDTTFGIPAVLPEADLFPYKTIAMLIGLVLLPTVSRLTARWDPPRSLGRLTFDEA
jgi:high affinity choline transporter 7